MWNRLGIVDGILRNREAFFEEIRTGKEVGKKVLSMLFASVVFLGIYGIVLGLSKGPAQAGVTLLKLPALFLLTLVICVPSLHYFNILFGSRQSFMQTLALMLTAISTTAVLLVSLAPITFFFLITDDSYVFYKLLNVFFFAVTGYFGVIFLRDGMKIVVDTEDAAEGQKERKLIFLAWSALYGFVGSQMAYTLAPFIGDPSKDFIFFREVQGNFFIDVLESLWVMMGR